MLLVETDFFSASLATHKQGNIELTEHHPRGDSLDSHFSHCPTIVELEIEVSAAHPLYKPQSRRCVAFGLSILQDVCTYHVDQIEPCLLRMRYG